MDILTHTLLGAVAAQSISQRHHLRAASAVGAIAALLPDLDVLIRSADDVLMTLTYHRHFSHSLFFAPFGALLASVILWPLFRRHLNMQRLYGYALIGYGSACLLDVCTSYGTHLLWPLSTKPFSLSIIAVVDPVFSLLLVLAATGTFYTRKHLWCWLGLGSAVLYLALGAVQHQRAYAAAEALAMQRDVTPSRIIIKPTLANLILWRAITVEGEEARADAVRIGFDPEPVIYPGMPVQLVSPTAWKNLSPGSRAYRDLNRFYQLTDGMLVEHPHHENFIGDLRYAMMPTGVEPIWGIRIDPQNPDAPPAFVVEREFTSKMREKLIAMLKGETRAESSQE